MAKLGYTPQQTDLMEVWQVAALLGVDKNPVIESEEFGDRPFTFQGRPITAADQERLQKFAAGPVDDSPDITDRVMRQMGIVT